MPNKMWFLTKAIVVNSKGSLKKIIAVLNVAINCVHRKDDDHTNHLMLSMPIHGIFHYSLSTIIAPTILEACEPLFVSNVAGKT